MLLLREEKDFSFRRKYVASHLVAHCFYHFDKHRSGRHAFQGFLLLLVGLMLLVVGVFYRSFKKGERDLRREELLGGEGGVQALFIGLALFLAVAGAVFFFL